MIEVINNQEFSLGDILAFFREDNLPSSFTYSNLDFIISNVCKLSKKFSATTNGIIGIDEIFVLQTEYTILYFLNNGVVIYYNIDDIKEVDFCFYSDLYNIVELQMRLVNRVVEKVMLARELGATISFNKYKTYFGKLMLIKEPYPTGYIWNRSFVRYDVKFILPEIMNFGSLYKLIKSNFSNEYDIDYCDDVLQGCISKIVQFITKATSMKPSYFKKEYMSLLSRLLKLVYTNYKKFYNVENRDN